MAIINLRFHRIGGRTLAVISIVRNALNHLESDQSFATEAEKTYSTKTAVLSRF